MLGKLMRELITGGGAPLRLHIGGTQRHEGWRVLNVLPGEHVDYVGDCRDLSRFADASVHEIYASHVLEHLGYAELPVALAGFHRVLRPGGTLRISVPDLGVLSRLFLDPACSTEERIAVARMIFGGQIDEHDFHRCGLDYDFLAGFLDNAGFARVEKVERFDLFRDMSGVQLRGIPISLNVIATK